MCLDSTNKMDYNFQIMVLFFFNSIKKVMLVLPDVCDSI